ncbi:MAG: APC family permease [Candidatus Latescibacteria bacterium]|nr:APC family permease [Candidatus Latescibacterota bacterium]
MRTTEYFTLAFGTIIGVGWVLVMDDWLGRGGPLGAMLGFLIGGLLLVPIGYVYSRLVTSLPDAGSEVTYTAQVFPRSVSFTTGWFMTLAYLIVCPWEAVAIGKIVVYLIPSLDTIELYQIGEKPMYLPRLLLGLGLTGVIVGVNYRGIRLSAWFQNITTFGLLAIFVVFAGAGLLRGSVQQVEPLFAQPGISGALISCLLVMQIVPYFMTGFESVPKCAEEANANFQTSGFTRAIFLALIGATLFYVIIIGVVAMIADWQQLLTVKFSTVVAFERAFQSNTLVNLIFLAMLLSLFKVFNGNFLAGTRLLFALGRRGLLPAALGAVHPAYRTPGNAVVFGGLLTVIGTVLGEAVLIPITEVGSFAAAVGWMATCVSFLKGAGRRAGETAGSGATLIAGLGALVCRGLLLMKLLPFVPGHFQPFEYVTLGLWLLLGGITFALTTERL